MAYAGGHLSQHELGKSLTASGRVQHLRSDARTRSDFAARDVFDGGARERGGGCVEHETPQTGKRHSSAGYSPLELKNVEVESVARASVRLICLNRLKPTAKDHRIRSTLGAW